MPEPRGRIYELALRALDEQDRQVLGLLLQLGGLALAAALAS
jgi:hypothetical protein